VAAGIRGKVQSRMVQRPEKQPQQAAAKRAAVISLELLLAAAIFLAALAFLIRH